MIYNLDGYQFVAPSRRKNKKYDVYLDGEYVLSFGDKRYEQFKDKIGYYSSMDHNDRDRRSNYINRHRKDIDNYGNAGYFAYNYLWSY